MNEEWKQVFNTKYEVSNTGFVRNSKTGRILKPYLNKNGYLILHISVNGIIKQYYVHKLVALYYCHNDNPIKTRINHIDENKTNNNASNLEWVTQQENVQKYWKNHPEHVIWNKNKKCTSYLTTGSAR